MPISPGGDDMYLLLVPYAILLVLEGVRFYLLAVCWERLADRPQFPLDRSERLNIKWYRWLLHSIKDWLVLGALGTIALWQLRNCLPLLLPVGMAGLALLVLVRYYAPAVLWLFAAGSRMPDGLLNFALSLALPSFGAARRRRVLYWSGAFILTGFACLLSWYFGGGAGALLWSLLTMILGFISLLRACTFRFRGLETGGMAERTG
jgi:hypothetical protein